MAIKILIFIFVLVAGLLGYAAIQPDAFRVERSASIKAPPEKVFALINDFHAWTAWSPWETKDPAMKRIHSGAASGKGAVYAWEGNNQVGQGSMQITRSDASSRITIQLDFIKPFEGHNIAEFTLQPEGDSTHVTWAMYGPSPYLSKLMGVFFDMDHMIGKDFEAGLANLKASAEK